MTSVCDYVIEIPHNCDFTIHNIPFGVFSCPSMNRKHRICSAAGNYVIDLYELCEFFSDESLLGEVKNVFKGNTLNEFMAHGRKIWVAARVQIQQLLRSGSLIDKEETKSVVFVPMEETQMHLPAQIGDYTG